jgi:hypothetical protein
LDPSQKMLYKDVMQETFKNLSAVEAKSLRDSLAKNLVNMQ